MEKRTLKSQAPSIGRADLNRNLKVLVVDDDDAAREYLCSRLGRNGYKTSICRNGQEALDLLARDHSVDVILSDVEMPECDGFSMLRNLRDTGDKTPVFMMSSTYSHQSIAETDAAGFFEKPILSERIGNLCDCILKSVKPRPLKNKRP